MIILVLVISLPFLKKLPGVFYEEKPFELVMALTAPTSVITLLVESN